MLFNGELNLISNTEPWTCHPRTQMPTRSQVIWRVVIKQISHWFKRAFSVMLYTLTSDKCGKHLPNKGSFTCEFWPGWNNWGCKHDLSPSSQAETSLCRSTSIPSPCPLVQPSTPASRAQHPSADITMHGQRVIWECRGCCYCYLRSKCTGPQGTVWDVSQMPNKKSLALSILLWIGCPTLTDNKR